MGTIRYTSLNEYADFSANTTSGVTKSITLPRNRFIRRIRVIAEAVVSAVGTSPNVLTLPRLVSNFSVKADGNTAIFDVSGEDLYQLNLRDYSTTKLSDGEITSTGTYRMEWIFDSAINPKETKDFSALIPAFSFNTFELEIATNTTLIAAGNSDTTTSSLKFYVVVEEVEMDKAEITSLYGSNLEKLAKVLISHKDASITTANSNYTGEIDLMVGFVISKILVRTNDTTTLTAVSTDDLITAYQIEQTGMKGNFIWDKQRWEDSKKQDVMEHGIYDEDALVGSISYDAVSSVDGLDARGMKQGDLKLKYNNTDTSMSYHITQVNVVMPQ